MAQDKHFDIDDAEEYDDGTRAVTYDNDDLLNSDSDNDATTKLSSSRKQRLQAASFKKTKQSKEGASALRVKNWDAGLMESAEYAGKVVKRKDVADDEEEDDEEDAGMASPDEDAMAEWSDAEPFGESGDDAEEEGDDDEEEASDMASDESEDDDDQDGEQDAEKLIRGFQKEASVQLMGSKESAKLVEKATHVRNQKIIWERCLEIQIYTKRLLTSSKDAVARTTADENKDAKAALIEKLYSCIDAVSGLQDKLCNSADLSLDDNEANKKRKRSSSTVDDVWSDIAASNAHALPQYNDILNTYSRKTNLSGGSQAKKFKAVNQDILAQVESVLADPLRVKRKAHAPVDPAATVSASGTDGETTADDADETDSDRLDELMYDDSDFYQQLLKEFIESGGGGAAHDALVRRTHRKKKKAVNRKASKGRVLRYTVHPKLENFMFPEPYQPSEMDVDELFRSIFGQARQA